MTLFNPVFNCLTPIVIKRLRTQADEGLTPADEAGSVVLRQPPASKLANLFRIDVRDHALGLVTQQLGGRATEHPPAGWLGPRTPSLREGPGSASVPSGSPDPAAGTGARVLGGEVAPQYVLMGYMPYATLLAQQFPWCGTLRLRGQAAEDDVKIALFELAAAQLDVVANVKRAYYDLHFNEIAESLLKKNRALADDFLKVARERYRGATATQVDVLRAEVAVSDIHRELENTSQAVNEARAELARLLHVSPETPLRTLPDLSVGSVPQEVERLYQLVCTSRPELQGRLAAIARDEKAVELARKRYYPNLTVGFVYQDMEKTNAETPRTASGQPNVGLFVGFNLPIYHKKLAAGVQEAQARAAADGQLLEAERDQAHRDIKDFFVQARVQQNVLSLLRRNNLPTAKQVLELTAGDYTAGNAGVDFLSLISAWRELLQVGDPDRPDRGRAGQDARLARASGWDAAQRASPRPVFAGRSGRVWCQGSCRRSSPSANCQSIPRRKTTSGGALAMSRSCLCRVVPWLGSIGLMALWAGPTQAQDVGSYGPSLSSARMSSSSFSGAGSYFGGSSTYVPFGGATTCGTRTRSGRASGRSA